MKDRMVTQWSDEDDACVIFLPEWEESVFQAGYRRRDV